MSSLRSPRQNGTYGSTGGGGYTNGYGNDRAYNPYGGDNPYGQADGGAGYGNQPSPEYGNQRSPEYANLRSPEGPRSNRRQGGYGGFAGVQNAAPVPEQDRYGGRPQVAPPTNLERSRAKRRSRSRGEGRLGDGNQRIEEVLQWIQQDWDFMTEDRCVPIQIALQLMDPSSLGLANRYDQFQEINQQLQSALKAIVNEHHQGFNSSIGTFHSIQSAIQTSQQRLRTLKESLVQAKANLATTKPELRGLATSSQNYDDMLQVLGAIEDLQAIPEKLEAKISEKRFLSAVEILQEGLKLIRRSEMENIGALSDLKVYLSNQEHSITDILIEELHSHLYLKSPYCENRWKQYAPNQAKSAAADGDVSVETRGRALYHFLDKLDTSVPMADDASRNPEADTFQYIQLIIESLNSLNRLDDAIDTIEDRLPVELFRVVERCNNEVDQRHPSSLRGARGKGGQPDIDSNSAARLAILNDLLWTLYARFEAIAEGHRVVHDVVAGIAKREKSQDASSLTRGFKELWKLYQSEIRSLLHDYLAADGNLSSRSGPTNQQRNVFQRKQRDKQKSMFRLLDMDTKGDDIASEREDLEFILKSSVPGLVSDSKQANSTISHANGSSNEGGATGHKLLFEPSVFNMGTLLPPSLAFLNRLKEIVPTGSDIVKSTLTSFLDDFLVNVFLPQLDETLVELCTQTFIEIDSFQQAPQWAMHSQKPIFKGTQKFLRMVTAFCGMLDRLPHDQAFSQLIITQMATFYDKCCGWYKALVMRSQPTKTGRRTKASAKFVDDEELRKAMPPVFGAEGLNIIEMENQESALLIERTTTEPLELMDLIADRGNIAGLCLLHTSMKWLAIKMAHLRRISNRATDSSRRESGRTQQRWTLVDTTDAVQEDTPAYLPLNQETAIAFDGVVNSYQQLAETALYTVHMEVRCHVLYHLNHAMRGPHQLEQLLNEPDPEVLALNSDLVGFDEELSTNLQPKQQLFITTGIGHLMDTLLMTRATAIDKMNNNGCARMQLNILVLQQNLKNIEADALLSRSALFFEFFTEGPAAVMAKVKKAKGDVGLSEDELKKLLSLYYEEQMENPRRDVAVQAKRQLDENLLELSEYMWQG